METGGGGWPSSYHYKMANKSQQHHRKEKLLKIPTTLREGWAADVTRSTPSSPEVKTSPLRTANELSRSVNFLLDVHEQRVERGLSAGSVSGSSEEMIPTAVARWNGRRQSSYHEKTEPIVAGLLPPTSSTATAAAAAPRRSSMSRIFDTGRRHSHHHSSAGSLLTSVLSKTLHRSKKYVLLLVSIGFFGFSSSPSLILLWCCQGLLLLDLSQRNRGQLACAISIVVSCSISQQYRRGE